MDPASLLAPRFGRNARRRSAWVRHGGESGSGTYGQISIGEVARPSGDQSRNLITASSELVPRLGVATKLVPR